MNNISKHGLVKSICLGLIFSLTITLGTVTKAEAAGGDVANAELNKVSSWATGDLDAATGNPAENKRRVTTKEAYSLISKEYVVSATSADCEINAYYYDSNMKYVKTEKLADGSSILKADNTDYVKFTLRYNPREKSMSLGMWGGKIGSEQIISISPVKEEVEEQAVEESEYELFDSFSSTSVNEWTSGEYSDTTGEAVTNKRRLASKDAFSVCEQTLEVSLASEDVRLKVYEYDEDMNLVDVNVASDGEDVTVDDETRFVRFALYRTYSEKSLSLGQWAGIFAGGLEVEVTASDSDNTEMSAPPVAEEAPVVEEEPAAEEAPVVVEPVKGFVPTEGESEIYNVIKEMLYTGDKSVRDISSLKVTINEASDAYARLINGEGYFYYAAAGNVWLSNLGVKNKLCTTAQLCGMDDDFLNRYNKMMSVIDKVLAKMDPSMSDIEKALIAHDYLTENITYDEKPALRSCAGGILANGRGVCAGFARAFATIMRAAGITAYDVSSTDMNHAWNYVVLDGQIYNVDCTWDTKTKNKSTEFHREYFVASDARFEKAIPSKHYNWEVVQLDRHPMPTTRATSTKYDKWFVHNTTSKMVYCEGFWYYADGTRIVRSDIEGRNSTTVLTESSNISIISLSQGVLQYKVNGITKTIKVK